MSYDTESKSRNILASPLGEEGHEVAKGVQANWIHRGAPRPANPVRRHPAKSVWTEVRMIMILDVDVTAERRHYNTHRLAVHRFAWGAADWRSGPRWSILSALCLVHPLPLRGVPLKGKREIWREKQGVIYFMYHSGVSPFGALRHHLSPAVRWGGKRKAP